MVRVRGALQSEIEDEAVEKIAATAVAIKGQRGGDRALAHCHSSTERVGRLRCASKSNVQEVGVYVPRQDKGARVHINGGSDAWSQNCSYIRLAENPRRADDERDPRACVSSIDGNGRTELGHGGGVGVGEQWSEFTSV